MTQTENSKAVAAVGKRIRRLRQRKGYSRSDLARRLKVDVSSIAGWEAGKRLPRDPHRARLARALDCDLSVLLSTAEDTVHPLNATLIETVSDLPAILAEKARSVKIMRAMRLSSPYSTAAYVQTDWRRIIGERIMAGEAEVQRIEIFYSLRRLKETLSNILRYDGKPYFVKAHCMGLTDVVPAMAGYSFDDADFFLGGYWTGIPPTCRHSLRLSGPVITEFFRQFWEEVWPRGTLLNIRGGHDLSHVQELAEKLGLKRRQWKRFVEEARELDIGDGAPPLI
ncbi:MAG TPA: helix-turn-helix transcriptional regulator [Rhizomicrobium sp.]|nr:helix-turn-helix transcriptional regulator [Rhizomicrobium sp.]